MATITVKDAAPEDFPHLLLMNKQLMEDEQFDRPLSDDGLKKRWDEFLAGDRYRVLLFEEEKNTIGYAVVHMDRTPLYLRHFFIKREFRKRGYGTESFHKMLDFLNTGAIDLDVMSWNDRGYRFWRSLGFTERCKLLTFSR